MNKLLVIAFCCACAYARVTEDYKNNDIHSVQHTIKHKNDGIPYDELKITTESSVGFEKIATEKEPTTTILPTKEIRIDLNVTKPGDHTDVEDVEEVKPKKTPDVGQPLLLTPLIENGKIREARKASKVNPDLFFGLPSYSGFLTVDEEYNSNLFFWYFPAPERAAGETPWLVWLQGGPGASSMVGLFDEIGPFTVDENLELKLRSESWGKEQSLLFIENPVGTGFSFTDNELGYAHHVNTSSAQLYLALQQFLEMFPELRAAPLFVAGESYAGKYVPGLAAEMHRRRHNTRQPINLQGLAIGNGFIEPSILSNYSRVAYHFGLIDKDLAGQVKMMDDKYMELVEANDAVGAKHQWSHTVVWLQIVSQQTQVYNVLKDDLGFRRYEAFLRRPEVRQALHVGGVPYSYVNLTVNTNFATDFLSNARPELEDLLEHYRVLIYSGQLDLMVPYVLTEENLLTWSWSGKEKFARAGRQAWLAGTRVAGFHKSGGNLTEVMVRGAGHTVPADQPAAAKELIEKFVRGQPPRLATFSDFYGRVLAAKAEHFVGMLGV